MPHDYSSEQYDAIQAVVDRVGSYQEGAADRTVDAELREALSTAGVEIDDADVSALATAIEEEHGTVQARDVLSTGGA